MRLFCAGVFLTLGMMVLAGVSGCDDADVVGKKAPPSTTPGGSSSTPSSSTPSPSKSSSNSGDEPSPSAGEDVANAQKIPLPELPSGAGEIDEDAPEGFTKTASGLRYRILRKSEGRKPVPGDDVVAHYKGWLDNGKQFDSSFDRGEPIPFSVKSGPGGVIEGWVEGVQLIGEGAMIELEIPSDLAYGPRGRPGIPPNARLHFIVELKQVQ